VHEFDAWLWSEDGSRRRIEKTGLILGRSPDCHLILADRAASQRHVMLLPGPEWVDLIPLGRNPTLVDEQVVGSRTRLVDGAGIAVPGGRFRVELKRSATLRGVAWRVRLPSGRRYALRPLPMTLGGGDDDDLRVPGWPPGALIFHRVEGALVTELTVTGARNGRLLQEGSVEDVHFDERWTIDGVDVVVEGQLPIDAGATALAVAGAPVIEILFEFLSNGGRLRIVNASHPEPRELLLPELRGRLMATLMSPPGDYTAGEPIPDDILIPRIWPGERHRDRSDLNQLIHRTRKSLLKAGCNPSGLLERVGRSGTTRIKVSTGTRVEVR